MYTAWWSQNGHEPRRTLVPRQGVMFQISDPVSAPYSLNEFRFEPQQGL
jgi:hypothetical protein